MRTKITLALIGLGLLLEVVSYFFFAAPLGIAVDESFSNPRIPFAAAIFALGVIIVCLAAVVYELLPDRSGK